MIRDFVNKRKKEILFVFLFTFFLFKMNFIRTYGLKIRSILYFYVFFKQLLFSKLKYCSSVLGFSEDASLDIIDYSLLLNKNDYQLKLSLNKKWIKVSYEHTKTRLFGLLASGVGLVFSACYLFIIRKQQNKYA